MREEAYKTPLSVILILLIIGSYVGYTLGHQAGYEKARIVVGNALVREGGHCWKCSDFIKDALHNGYHSE